MEKKLIALFSIRRKLWHRLSSPFAGLVLALSLAISSLPTLDANAAEVAPTYKQVHVANRAEADATQKPSNVAFPADGTYLYGQSPEANQVGNFYAVIEVDSGNAVGAFYMPYSSFDCFYGEVGSSHLNLTVVNSYEQASYDYSLPMASSEVAASGNAAPSGAPQLVGYHLIDGLSDTDHQMLATCRANYSSEI
ncbi:MAG: hypothetical protein VKL39_06325 [Leptolyngbyaceae bacterium]|nr:hypothetical protein [Leptolyngbyaceae bacterium]